MKPRKIEAEVLTLEEARDRLAAEFPGVKQARRRLESSEGNIYAALEATGIPSEPVRDWLVPILVAGTEKRLKDALGWRLLFMLPKRRRLIAEALAGFGLGNGAVLAIAGVEGERLRRNKRKAGGR